MILLVDLHAWIRECGLKTTFESVTRKENVFINSICYKVCAAKKDVTEWE